ncbi:hypothetical protein ACFLU3_04925 [Chloroflexota bacterium]
MSSSIACICGKRINKNLFSGNNCNLLVPEAMLDKEPILEDDVSRIIIEAEVVVKCPNCHRIAIINDKTNEISFYEKTDKNEV